MTEIARDPGGSRGREDGEDGLTRLAQALRAAAAGDVSVVVAEDADGSLGEAQRAFNQLVDDLVRPTTEIARVIDAVAEGDLEQRMALAIGGQPLRGEFARIGATVNQMVDQLSAFADEVTRVAREVGTEGKLGGQATVPGVAGVWADLTENVNVMARNLTGQVRGIAQVTTAVAQGDLTGRVTVEAKGEVAVLAETINEMVERLGSFADEVTRVAREVGTEGRLGGQATVPGVAGVWADLTENVNVMAANLTSQVRNIADVTTAVAGGDLSQMITVDVRGEVAELKETVNTMVEQLRAFADEVTRVAREVGTEGRLGGQAAVPGVAGTWQALTENVNQLAANLTTQVRAIAEVSTAVTEGDLTRSIDVRAEGEVAELAETINRMVGQLRATTQVNAEQDWLKTNLARISGLLQGQRDLGEVARLIMRELTPVVSARHGAFFLVDDDTSRGGPPLLRLRAGYAYVPDPAASPPRPDAFRLGEGLVGQAALEGRAIVVDDLPPGYVSIASGLGGAAPATLLVLPVVFEGQVLGVLELASLRPFADVERAFLDQVAETLGVAINTLRATMRTEELLAQSQALTSELTNQAAQLELSSSYKSEFLANMSHELRTPLNSLLILSRLLADNPDATLTTQQVEFAATIHSAGNDLLRLINDILDLSKVEAGKMEVAVAPVVLEAVCADLERAFRPIAAERGLAFSVTLRDGLPRSVVTDDQRLAQVLRNLLSNACKFTHAGSVALDVAPAPGGVAFAVRDTGVGIAPEQLGLVFEAFQQGDGTTSRRFGGTGLGLSISREISRLLGGDVTATSTPGGGSTFTLTIPLVADGASAALPEAAAAVPAPREAPAPSPAPPADEPPAPVAEATPAAEELPREGVEDDRNELAPGRRSILAAGEDGAAVAEAVAAIRATGRLALGARTTPTTLALAREHRPEAIVLLGEGAALARLKHHVPTRHHPVFVAGSSDRLAALRAGAAAHLGDVSPAEAVRAAGAAAARLAAGGPRRLAVVGTGLDAQTRELLAAGEDADVVDVSPTDAAGGALRGLGADCVVVCLGADPAAGVAVLEAAEVEDDLAGLAWLAYAPGRLGGGERARVDALAGTLNLMLVASPDRLVDEAVLRLHRDVARLPARVRAAIDGLRPADFAGRKVLVVDDDVRNLFALASVLEQRGMRVVFAEDGREGIAKLRDEEDVDLVLLDVMMPGLDGHETARAIRAMPRFASLPIISLTAKAMRGDRDKSLAAGASDYIAKPVDVDELLGLIGVWLPPR